MPSCRTCSAILRLTNDFSSHARTRLFRPDRVVVVVIVLLTRMPWEHTWLVLSAVPISVCVVPCNRSPSSSWPPSAASPASYGSLGVKKPVSLRRWHDDCFEILVMAVNLRSSASDVSEARLKDAYASGRIWVANARIAGSETTMTETSTSRVVQIKTSV